MRTIWLVALLFLVAACGEPPNTASPAPPDQPVSEPAGSVVPSGAPSPVAPVGNSLDPNKVPWTSATPADGGRSLDVVWWSGVEPCYVLDRVEVDEQADQVTVTLYEGKDARSPDAVCIEIAIQKTTRVQLRAPLGDRKVIDGAAN